MDLTDSAYAPNALPLGQMSNPIAVAYDPREEKVYWSDVVKKTISRAGLDGSNKQVIVSSNIESKLVSTFIISTALSIMYQVRECVKTYL